VDSIAKYFLLKTDVNQR